MRPRTLWLLVVVVWAIVGFRVCATAHAQGFVDIRMVGDPQGGIVTPGALAIATGRSWLDSVESAPLEGQLELGGYHVVIDGRPALLTHVSSEGLVFLVPREVTVGTNRTVAIHRSESTSFVSIEIAPFRPTIGTQVIADVEYVTAFSLRTFFPQLFVGEPIFVGMNEYNQVSIVTKGFLTGQVPQNAPYVPVTRLQGAFDSWAIPSTVSEFPGFPGAERLSFFAPPALKGAYRLTVQYAGLTSNEGIILFKSDGPSSVSIERERGRRR